MEIIHVLYKNNKLCFTKVMDQESHNKLVDKVLESFFHIYDFDKEQQ